MTEAAKKAAARDPRCATCAQSLLGRTIYVRDGRNYCDTECANRFASTNYVAFVDREVERCGFDAGSVEWHRRQLREINGDDCEIVIIKESLAASAPDLLEALKALADATRDCGYYVPGTMGNAVRAARAALARATGGQS